MVRKNIPIDIGKILRKGRIEKEWTQKELAKRMNVKAGLVSKWETNRLIPGGADLIRLASLLGIAHEFFPDFKQSRSSKSIEKLQKEIEKIWETLRRKEQEETDFKQITILLLKEKFSDAKLPKSFR